MKPSPPPMAAQMGSRFADWQSESDYFSTLVNAPVFGIDTNGQIDIWNAKAAEVTGEAAESRSSERLSVRASPLVAAIA